MPRSARQWAHGSLGPACCSKGAPEHMRGGNTRHTRNIRCAHKAADQFFTGPYPVEEYLEDLIQVTGGPANLDLAKFTIRATETLPHWMSRHGRIGSIPLPEPCISGGPTDGFWVAARPC